MEVVNPSVPRTAQRQLDSKTKQVERKWAEREQETLSGNAVATVSHTDWEGEGTSLQPAIQFVTQTQTSSDFPTGLKA
jgi:hypothetical protein